MYISFFFCIPGNSSRSLSEGLLFPVSLLFLKWQQPRSQVLSPKRRVGENPGNKVEVTNSLYYAFIVMCWRLWRHKRN